MSDRDHESAIAWYLRGLLGQPCPPPFVPFPVPDVAATGGRVHQVVASFYLTVNEVLAADRRAAIKSWQDRQLRMRAWLAVLEARPDDVSAFELLEATPRVPTRDEDIPRFEPAPSPCLTEVYALLADDERRAGDSAFLNRQVVANVEKIDEMLNRLAEGEFANGLHGLNANAMRNADAMCSTIEWLTEGMRTVQRARCRRPVT